MTEARHARTLVAVAMASAVLLSVCFGRLHGMNGWDDTFYLAQLSSIVRDGDVDLRNDALDSSIPPQELVRLLTTTLPDGGLMNTFSIGPALLWSPAYLLISAAWLRAGSRWTPQHFAAIHLLSLGFCVYLAWVLARLGRRCGVTRRDALFIGAGLLAASPLLVYGFRAYTMSHLPAAVAACWFLCALLTAQRTARISWAALAGVSFGCLVLIRWQDALFALLMVPVGAHLRRQHGMRRVLDMALAGLAGFLPVALLQSHAWWVERGALLTLPQGAGYVDLAGTNLRSFLLSGRSGFLPWMPLALVCGLGFVLPWRLRLDRGWRWTCLAVIAAEIVVSASVTDWWGGFSYGARRMTSLVPLLAIGLANVSRAPRGKWVRGAIVACVVFGFFTAGLYNRRVEDLALVFLGRPSSDAGPALAAGLVSEPEEARRAATRWPLRPGLPDYFPNQAGGRVLTVVCIVAGLVFLSFALTRRNSDRLLATMLALYFLLAIAAHARLAGGPRRDPAERFAWLRFVNGGEATDPLPANAPVAAYRYIERTRSR